MQKETKEKVKQKYVRRVKLVARSNLYGRNLIRVINAWALGVVMYMYSAGIFLDWSDEELRATDVKRRKRMTVFEHSIRRGV